MTLAYDGTAYCGWQRQRDSISTVQRQVEIAAGIILSHPVIVDGSSRTDSGVHAQGQVAVLRADTTLDAERLRRAINSRLPEDILIRDMAEVSENFNIRRAKHKRYRYLIWADRDRPLFFRHFTYHFYKDLDIQRMQDACRHFVGQHDFNAFKGVKDKRDFTVRTIFSCNIHRRGPLVIFGVEGNGFLFHMVRSMVGTVLEIGRGHWHPDCIPEIIASRDRERAGPTAMPQGLFLQWIRF